MVSKEARVMMIRMVRKDKNKHILGTSLLPVPHMRLKEVDQKIHLQALFCVIQAPAMWPAGKQGSRNIDSQDS
jgi:hypothetical protein